MIPQNPPTSTFYDVNWLIIPVASKLFSVPGFKRKAQQYEIMKVVINERMDG